MGVVEAVRSDIEALGSKAQDSGLAATALSLARELDEPGNSATSKSMCAKALIDVLREIRSVAPAVKEEDELAKLRERRDTRLAGRSASTAPSRT